MSSVAVLIMLSEYNLSLLGRTQGFWMMSASTPASGSNAGNLNEFCHLFLQMEISDSYRTVSAHKSMLMYQPKFTITYQCAE
jgi:hypothetical protein